MAVVDVVVRRLAFRIARLLVDDGRPSAPTVVCARCRAGVPHPAVDACRGADVIAWDPWAEGERRRVGR